MIIESQIVLQNIFLCVFFKRDNYGFSSKCGSMFVDSQNFAGSCRFYFVSNWFVALLCKEIFITFLIVRGERKFVGKVNPRKTRTLNPHEQ